MSSEAFVTLATNDDYGLGAVVLAQSIRQVGTKRNLVVLISNHLSDLIRETLEKCFDELIVVEELNSNDIEHLNLLSRPELGITFTKIHCWLLEQYTKCVFLDADCLVLRQIDQLFEREQFSAAPDAGWPDCFNSGVFVYQPSKDTFNKLMLFASQQNSSFDGGDQGLLNAYFSNWRTNDISRHLPFTYNVTANAFYSYLPAVTRFRNDIHIVHFAGALKPWQLTYNPNNEQLSGNLGGQNDIQRDFLLSWWRIMYQKVWPYITQFNQQSNSNNKTIDGEGQFDTGFVASLNYGNLIDNKGIEVGSAAHRRAWESGHIDYYGRDSFSNIQQQLERNIEQRTQIYHPTQQRQIIQDKTSNGIIKYSNQQTTNHEQNIVKQSTAVIQTSLQQSTTNLQEKILKQTTTVTQTSFKQPTTTNLEENISKQTKPSSLETTNTLQTSLKQTKTTNLEESVEKKPTPSSLQPTNIQTSFKEATTDKQQQTKTTNTSQNIFKQTTPRPVEAKTTTNYSENVLKQTTPTVTQTTNYSENVLKQTAPTVTQTTNIFKSSLKETTTTPKQQQQTTNVSGNIFKQSTPTTNISKTSLKEVTPTFQTNSEREKAEPLIVSINPNENKYPSNEHESKWTVKSTIVTAFTQGEGELAGPTLVSKVVSESTAGTTSIKQMTDSTNSSELNLTVKTPNDHFAWLFDKLFVAITYAISLCYLLFLVAIRRSKNGNIIHGNGTSVPTVQSSTNNGKRVNKEIQ